jgi:phage repressor protein C with HTH and peptisase S24 domain
MSPIVHNRQPQVKHFCLIQGATVAADLSNMVHMANRLREMRESRGWTLDHVARLLASADETGKSDKATAKTISRLELEERKLTVRQALLFAKVYGVGVDELVVAGSSGDVVPIVGYVGAGEVVHTFPENEPLEWTSPPGRPGAPSANAVRVRGDSMWPAYKPGDLLLYFPADMVAPDALGEDCVIRLKTGETYVKTLKRGTAPGRYRLVSCRSSVPDIDDVEVEWAAKIRWVERR